MRRYNRFFAGAILAFTNAAQSAAAQELEPRAY